MTAEPIISPATRPSTSPSPTAEQLAQAIHSPVASVAARAREGLADLGPAAITVLEGVLAEPSSRARWEATHALADMHAPAAAPALVHELTDPDGGVRWLAAEGLAALGPIALEPLCKALLQHSESAWLREGAHHVLMSLLHAKQLPRPAYAVLAALEGVEPAIAVMPAAEAALRSGFLSAS